LGHLIKNNTRVLYTVLYNNTGVNTGLNPFHQVTIVCKCDVSPAFLMCVKDAQNRAELYSENETRVTATRDMPCHTWDFFHRPLTRVKDARQKRRCDIALKVPTRQSSNIASRSDIILATNISQKCTAKCMAWLVGRQSQHSDIPA